MIAKPIRVIQFIYRLNVEGGGGGIARFVIELSRSLDPNLFKVAICTLGNTGTRLENEWIKTINSEGINAFSAADWDENKPYRSFLKAFKYLSTYFNGNQVDILHSHHEFSDIMVLLLKLQTNPPAIIRTIHYGYHVEWKRRPIRRLFLTNFLYPILFNNEIGVSQSITNRLNQRLIARLVGSRVQNIYNAVDVERFSNVQVNVREKKQSLNLPDDSLLIGSIGRLTEQKGYTYLVNAAALLIKQLPQTYILIIGDGELSEQLKEQAQCLGIASHIIFTGPRPDVEELLACMDIFASSSLWEGLPTVLMESMASGIPIVATDIPGTRELIQPGITGWLAPPGDAKALSETILKAIQATSLTNAMADNAKELLTDFSINAVVKKYESLYQSIIW